MSVRRVQVVIIGAGPSGLLLGQLLHGAGIEAVILERQSAEYVLGRIRAGVLEQGTVGLLEEIGAADRLHREGLVHDGVALSFDNELHRIDLARHTGKHVTVMGRRVTGSDGSSCRPAQKQFMRPTRSTPRLSNRSSFRHLKRRHNPPDRCDFIAGCDGYHGVSRKSSQAMRSNSLSGFIRSATGNTGRCATL